MFYRILSTDERGSSWRRLCRCWLHQGLPWRQPLVRPAAMESLPWRQPFLSIIECMCNLPMYWMYILPYIVLSQKWLNKDDQTNIRYWWHIPGLPIMFEFGTKHDGQPPIMHVIQGKLGCATKVHPIGQNTWKYTNKHTVYKVCIIG